VQVCEENLVFAKQRVLGCNRLLDLKQQITLGPNLFGCGKHRCAFGNIRSVGETRTDSGAGLDEYLVTATNEFVNTGWGDGHSVLVVLDFGWNSYAHFLLLGLN
jgi:hypothetical protein